MSDVTINRIANVVSARSPQGLRRAMFRNNAQKGIAFAYHDIQFVNGQWFAWYHEEVSPRDLMSRDEAKTNTISKTE